MSKDEIIFFLSYGLEWLINASDEKLLNEVKEELKLWVFIKN